MLRLIFPDISFCISCMDLHISHSFFACHRVQRNVLNSTTFISLFSLLVKGFKVSVIHICLSSLTCTQSNVSLPQIPSFPQPGSMTNTQSVASTIAQQLLSLQQQVMFKMGSLSAQVKEPPAFTSRSQELDTSEGTVHVLFLTVGLS